MRAWIGPFALLLALPGLQAFPALARAPAEPSRAYVLAEGSTFATGCFGACACPTRSEPLIGTFILTFTGFDPLFDHYAVSDVKWMVPRADGSVQIVGSGEYRIGGEFAIMHQLSLELSVASQTTQHFDSGLQPGGGDFPKIDIEVSLHDRQQCQDTVIHVVATPAVAGVSGADFGLRSPRPNPFHAELKIDWVLPIATAVDLAVFDLSGREVRTLAKGKWLEVGPHSLIWDGRRDDGRQSPAGVYFLRLSAENRVDLRAAVKLPPGSSP